MEFIPSFKPTESLKNSLWLVFSEKEQSIALSEEGHPFFLTPPGENTGPHLYLGTLNESHLYCLGMGEPVSLPDGARWEPFRDVYREQEGLIQYPLSRGKQLLEWNRTHQFCGSCGTLTEPSDKEHVRICPSCNDHFYPRMAPAVIVRITRDDRILLARNVRFPEGLYSHIAGFVDPGESLEQAIHREIREEVGLEVDSIRYFGSQSWPMPHSLMLAFTAEAIDDRAPVPDEDEILEAAWFTRDNMPNLPGPGSIAGQMLQDFLSDRD